MQTLKSQAKGVPLASNQVQYSLLYRAPERNGVVDALREAGATLIAYSPLAQGLLTGALHQAALLGVALAAPIASGATTWITLQNLELSCGETCRAS